MLTLNQTGRISRTGPVCNHSVDGMPSGQIGFIVNSRPSDRDHWRWFKNGVYSRAGYQSAGEALAALQSEVDAEPANTDR